jgi:hypothetical protein
MWLRRLALLTVCAALTVPLFVTTIPPLLDYPNHLARMAVLATGRHDPDLAQIYAIDWHLAPNFGMDLVVPLLAQIMPLTLAGKFFLALALILPLLGTVALHDVVFEKRSWWPLASAIVVYNAALLAGSLNFAVGIGLAMLGTACWIRLRHHARWQTLAGALIVAALFFVQAFAAIFLLMMIAGFELREGRQERSNPARAGRLVKLGLVALPTVLLYLQTWLAGDGVASPRALVQALWSTQTTFNAFRKAIGAAASFSTYDIGSDLLILIAVTAALAALSLARKLTCAWPATIALVLMLAYPFLPDAIAGAGWIDPHLPVLAGFLLFAGITPRRLGRRETAVLGLAFAALIVARLGVITLAWQRQNADLANITAVLTPVKAQDRVPVLIAPETAAGPAGEPVRWRFSIDQPSFWHIATPALDYVGGTEMAALYRVTARERSFEPVAAQLN